jgi:cobalt/nickel transport protein
MRTKEIIIGLVISLILAGAISLFASGWPDGLEKVASDNGFIEKGDIEPVFGAPMPDYLWPNVKSETVATSLAGICGTLLVFSFGFGLAKTLKRKET